MTMTCQLLACTRGTVECVTVSPTAIVDRRKIAVGVSVRAVAVSPWFDGWLLACSEGLLALHRGAERLRYIPLPTADLWSLAVCGPRVLVGTRPLEIWQSEDSVRWTHERVAAAPQYRPAPHSAPRIEAVLTDRQDRRWAGVHSGPAICLDASPADEAMHVPRDVHCLAETAAGILAGTGNGLHRREPNCGCWQTLPVDPTRWFVTTLTVAPHNSECVVACVAAATPKAWVRRERGADAMLYYSRGGGINWRKAAITAFNPRFAVRAFTWEQEVCWGVQADGHLLRSTDGGTTWHRLDGRLSAGRCLAAV